VKKAGQIALFRFPRTDLVRGKLRPVLLIGRFPGPYGDWLTCMVSSRLRHCVAGFDEIIDRDDADFLHSGLKTSSLIRVGRLAVVEEGMLLGSIGQVSSERLKRIKTRLAVWLTKA